MFVFQVVESEHVIIADNSAVGCLDEQLDFSDNSIYSGMFK